MNKKEKKQLLTSLNELANERIISISLNIWLKSKMARFMLLFK